MHTTLYALDRRRFEDTYLSLGRRVPLARWRDFAALALRHGAAADALDELDASSLVEEGGEVVLSAGAARVVHHLCIAECACARVETCTCEFFFGDLEADPPPWAELPDDLQGAWHSFLALADLGGRGRHTLPTWLAAANDGGAGVGLLDPGAVRGLASQAHRLEGWLTAHLRGNGMREDARQLLALVTQAAVLDGWVLGWEPGT